MSYQRSSFRWAICQFVFLPSLFMRNWFLYIFPISSMASCFSKMGWHRRSWFENRHKTFGSEEPQFVLILNLVLFEVCRIFELEVLILRSLLACSGLLLAEEWRALKTCRRRRWPFHSDLDMTRKESWASSSVCLLLEPCWSDFQYLEMIIETTLAELIESVLNLVVCCQRQLVSH